MGDLSPHFSSSEFKSRDGTLIRPPEALLRLLEGIRALTGKPLPILSGYRSPNDNRRVGGAPRSQHLLGAAADISPGRATVAQAQALGARGIGYRGRWVVHVDVRSSSPAVFRD